MCCIVFFQADINIGSIITERIQAMRRLEENPFDVQALSSVHKMNEKVSQTSTQEGRMKKSVTQIQEGRMKRSVTQIQEGQIKRLVTQIQEGQMKRSVPQL